VPLVLQSINHNGWRYAVVIFYGFETLNLIDMNTKRIEEIQKETAYPDSISVQQALLKVWNECEQEKAVKNNAVLPLVSNSALKDNSKLVDNMCMSYRHDFGLMAEQDKQTLRFECKEWLRAYENNREHCC